MAKKYDSEKQDSLQALKAAIRSGTPGRLYIFHGEEVFLLHHYFEQLKKALLDELTESFNFHKLNNETFDVQSFADSVEAMPMMADFTLVQVDEVDIFKLPDAERTKLAEVLSDIPGYCTVVFTYETVQWKPDKRLKKLWEAIQSNAAIVEFAKQGQRELIAWVSRHFLARGKRISNDLCAYLIDITGGTMTALAGEISKISSYSAADEIVKADIDAVTEPVLDALVFQMTDLISEGKYGQTLQKLQTLLKMQEEPLYILGAIGSHFRRLSTARTLLDNGRGATDLMKLYHIPDYPARKTMDAARLFPPEFCARAAELVLETDYKMKTSFDDPNRLLELLILQLAQEARRG
ncbi:MAG: DNA polymerase III subunit delta [Oscillospiraceae bacterium]|nr:DNA polymerase III subunit delta [Oscillospiraceae bacterium]